MTDLSKAGEADVWLLIKRDLYWRPASQGYTGIRDEAGHYTLEEAKARAEGGTTMVRLSDAPEFRAVAYSDLVIKHLTKQRDDALAALRSSSLMLEEAERVLEGVIEVADRETDEFRAARELLAKLKERK